MQEAYKIGVEIALQGNIGVIIERLIRQFATLDEAVLKTQQAVKSLGESLRALNAEGTQAAASWRSVAGDMQKAATSAREAARASAAGAAQRASAASATAAASPPPQTIPGMTSAVPGSYMLPFMLGTASIPRLAYKAPLALPAPYRSTSTEIESVGQPYFPYGYLPLPTTPSLGSRSLVPYGSPQTGFTLNGEAETIPGTGFRMQGPASANGAMVPYTAGGRTAGGVVPQGYYFPPRNGGLPPMPPPPGGYPPGTPGSPGYVPPGGGAPGGAGGGRNNPGELVADAGAAWMGWKAIQDIFGQTADVEDMMHRLSAQGFSADQQQNAYSKAFDLQRTVKPSRVLENLDIASHMMAVVQSPDEVLSLLPAFSELNVLLQRTGHSGGIGEMISAIRAGEYRGVLSHYNEKTGKNEVDPGSLENFVKSLLVANTITGGDVDPQAFLKFLRSSNYAGANLNDKSFFASELAMIQAMGPSGAGRALQGFIQQFGAGKMSEGSANLLMQMGVIHGGGDARHNPLMLKAGMGQFILLPGAMDPGVQMEASKEPEKFAEEYLFPRIRKWLTERLGPTYTKADAHDRSIMEMNYVGSVTSRQPGARELAELVRVMALIDRDKAAYEAALGRDIPGLLMAGNPKVEAAGVGAAGNAAQIAMGETVIKDTTAGLGHLTDALNNLSKWAEGHGEITKTGLEALAAGVATIGGVAAVRAMFLLGGTTGGLLAAIAGGAVVLTEAFIKLDAELHSLLPSIFGSAEQVAKTQKEIGQNGVWAPWWAPVVPGGGVHLNRVPSWIPGHSFLDRTLGTEDPQQSHAPIPQSSTSTGSTGAVPVKITNAHDLIQGMAFGTANQGNRPSTGYSGIDSRMDPGLAYHGNPN